MAHSIDEQETQDFTWINCPNCGQKIFKALEDTFSVEIPCNSCKAIYVLTSDGTQVCYEEVREPKRHRSQHLPTHTK